MTGEALLELHVEAEVIHWRGPSPFHFISLPLAEADAIREAARSVSYGWGMVPVEGEIGAVTFTTALFPKDETYFLPLKDAVRRQADVTIGDRIAVTLRVRAKS